MSENGQLDQPPRWTPHGCRGRARVRRGASRGGDNPTNETPAYLIERSSHFVHDEGMEQLANLPVDALLNPAVIGSAIAVSAALVSGLAARMVEICEDHMPRRRSD